LRTPQRNRNELGETSVTKAWRKYPSSPEISRAYARDIEEQIKQIRDDPAPLESSDEPAPLMDIELHQAFLSHFQQEGLASFLIHDIGAFHDFVDFKRLLAERVQDIFSIIQHN
jgi:hypothetical protein